MVERAGILTGTIHGLDISNLTKDSSPIQELARTIIKSLPESAFDPPLQDSIEFSCSLLPSDTPGWLINIRLDPEAPSNEILVKKVWEEEFDFSNPPPDVKHVWMNGPMTMAVAVALAYRMRRRFPRADLAMFDPDTGEHLSLSPPDVPGSAGLLQLDVSDRRGECRVECKLLSAGYSKAELWHSAARELSDGGMARPAKSVNFSGRVPIAMAAAICLYLSGDSTGVWVEDPGKNDHVQAAPYASSSN